MSTTVKILVLILFCNVTVWGQKNSTKKVLTYTIKQNINHYTIIPKDNYLFVGKKNKIQISVIGSNKIAAVKTSNGRVIKTNEDSIFVIDNLIPGYCLLSIYEKGKNGKNKIVLNKQYTVINYPIISVNGVKSDSVISKLLLCGGIVKARYGNYDIEAQVLGFKMEILEKDSFIIDSSLNNRLTKKMRQYVSNLKEGSLVYIKNIQYVKADGSVKIDPILRLFIGKEEKKFYMFDF